MKRQEAREKVFRIIFQKEFHDDFLDMYERLLEEEGLRGSQGEYAKATIEGILENIDKIDETISNYLVGWTFDRLSNHVKSILRVSVYEILFTDEIPSKVALDQGVKLSHVYCDEKEAKFVNGILDKIFKTSEK